METLEYVFENLCYRYGYDTQGIKMYFNEAGFRFYHSSIIRKSKIGEGIVNTWIGTVNAGGMWEMFAKMIVKIYADVKEQKEGGRKHDNM